MLFLSELVFFTAHYSYVLPISLAIDDAQNFASFVLLSPSFEHMAGIVADRNLFPSENYSEGFFERGH